MIPWHPFIVHFPLALTFLLPFGLLAMTILLEKKLLPQKAWIGLIIIQMIITASGYLAMETGEDDEKIVKEVVERIHISEHEVAAEKYVGVTVLTLSLSVALYFLAPALQLPLRLGVLALSLLAAFFAYETGQLGGELVYIHGASEAYDVQNKDEPLDEGEVFPAPEDEELISE